MEEVEAARINSVLRCIKNSLGDIIIAVLAELAAAALFGLLPLPPLRCRSCSLRNDNNASIESAVAGNNCGLDEMDASEFRYDSVASVALDERSRVGVFARDILSLRAIFPMEGMSAVKDETKYCAIDVQRIAVDNIASNIIYYTCIELIMLRWLPVTEA
jgi:hypothetical protein